MKICVSLRLEGNERRAVGSGRTSEIRGERTAMRHYLMAVITAGFLASNLAAIGQNGPGAQEKTQWERALRDLATYQIGSSTNGLAALLDCVLEADRQEAGRLALEQLLITFLKSGATVDAKQFICRQLHLIGSAASVPVLAELLQDPEMSDMSRYALEGIPDSAADRALLDALPKASDRYQIGIINSLGSRSTAAAAEPLLALASRPEEDLSRAAIGALKKIGGTNVVSGLAFLRKSVSGSTRHHLTDALLWCADALFHDGAVSQAEAVYRECFEPAEPAPLQAGALRGLLRTGGAKNLPFLLGALTDPDDALSGVAAELIRDLPDPTITPLVMAQVSALPPRSQVLVLQAWADRGDPAALPAVLTAVQSGNDDVSAAALTAVGAIGGPETVPLLTAFLADPNLEKNRAAWASLNQLRGLGVDEQILQMLPKQEVDIQARLVDCLAARRAASVIPSLIELAEEGAAPVWKNAWVALGSLAGAQHVPDLVRAMAPLRDPLVLEQASRAFEAILIRSENPAQVADEILTGYKQATVQARCALLRAAGSVGGGTALAQALEAWHDPHMELQDTAVRVLADWPDPTPADELLTIVKTTANITHRALAFRGYVRMAGLVRSDSPQKALTFYQQAMQQAAAPAEQKLVLGGLANLAHPDALKLAQSFLSDAAVQNEAVLATVKIAAVLGKRYPEEARSALQAVLDQGKDPALRKQAQDALRNLKTSAQ